MKSRFYAGELDLQQMRNLLMEARLQCGDDWRYWHVGDLAFWFFMVTCHLDPHEYIRLWYDARDRLAGYAILGEDPSFDCQVLPEYAWSGIESEAFSWAEARLSELRQSDAQRWSGPVVSGARQDDTRRILFLEELGFTPGTYIEVNMLRSLNEPIPEPVVPSGYQVRALSEAGETSNRAAAQRQVWHPYTVGNVSDDDYTRFMRMPGYQRELDVVAVAPDGVIAAYVNGWIDPVNRIGDFGPVGALPAYRQRGLTRAVLLECMRRMQAMGMERVCVSTGENNTPALRLYEGTGFRIKNRYLEFVKAS